MSTTTKKLILNRFVMGEVVLYKTIDGAKSLYRVSGQVTNMVKVTGMDSDGNANRKTFTCGSNKLETIWLQEGDKVIDTSLAKIGKVDGFCSIHYAATKKWENAVRIMYSDSSADYILLKDAAKRLDLAAQQ